MSKVSLGNLGTQVSTVVEALGMSPEQVLDSIIKNESKEVKAGKLEAPREVVIQSHHPAIEGNEEKGIEPRPETPEVTVELTSANKDRILAAMSSLPQFRSQFAEAVAEKIKEHRESNKDQYDAWLAEIKEYNERIGEIRQSIMDSDEEAAGDYDLEEFVIWSPYNVEPKDFKRVTTSSNSGGRSRSRSRVKWNLDKYLCSQRDVGGLHNVVLHRSGNEWTVTSDEDTFGPFKSASEAMKEVLLSQDMSPNRSANVFWAGEFQENGGTPKAWE